MRAGTTLVEPWTPYGSAVAAAVYRAGSNDDEPSLSKRRAAGSEAATNPEFRYRIEAWDEAESFVEEVLAVARSGPVAYAAYYAAAREWPGRNIALRDGDRIVMRWRRQPD